MIKGGVRQGMVSQFDKDIDLDRNVQPRRVSEDLVTTFLYHQEDWEWGMTGRHLLLAGFLHGERNQGSGNEVEFQKNRVAFHNLTWTVSDNDNGAEQWTRLTRRGGKAF